MKMRWLILMMITVGVLEAQTPAAKPVPKPVPKSVPNLIRGGDMEMLSPDSDPWGGVGAGNLRVFTCGSQLVNNLGEILKQEFTPGVGAGDLNGDGLPDLLVVDAEGYFWYFQNFGTKKPDGTFESVFKRGEVMNAWIQPRLCPKIHLVDVNGDGALDIVLGDYVGRLFMIKNSGTHLIPRFEPSNEGKSEEVKTEKDSNYWCNYLAPHYYDWDGDGKMDLIMGDGTFSANHIFFLKNSGSNGTPNFEPYQILIKGYGKEHLTPWVIDWDGDGKPDIVTGERDKGSLSVYINTSTDQANGPWTFKEPAPLNVGTSSATGTLSAPVFVDMNGDKLLDLLLGSASGSIRIAMNKGTATAPKFDAPTPIKGESPFPKFLRNGTWYNNQPGGVTPPLGGRFQLLRAMTKSDKYKGIKDLAGYDPELDLPKNTTGKSCLVFDFTDPKQEMFVNTSKTLPTTGQVYTIVYPDNIALKPDVEYELSFQVKGAGFSSTSVVFDEVGDNDTKGRTTRALQDGSFSLTSSWSEVIKTVQYKRTKSADGKSDAASDSSNETFHLRFRMQGDGAFYLDDVVLTEIKK